MQRELAKDISAGANRVAFLADNCDKVEQKDYMKRFSPEELSEMKDKLSDTAIKINDVEVEKRETVKEFNDSLKPLREGKQRLLKGLKNKAELVTEKCYKFIDSKTREVGYYNEDGT